MKGVLSNAKWNRSKQKLGNITSLDKWAWHLWEKSDFVPYLQDKGGGYALMLREDAANMSRSILNNCE
eukprot:981120-Prorocentrum_lima.AAC.1